MKSTNFLKTIKIVYLALGFGMVAFSGIALVVTKSDQIFKIPEMDDPFVIIVPVVLIIGVAVGNFLYKKLTITLTEKRSLEQKIPVFFSSNLVRWALIEGPVLLAIVSFLISHNTFYLIFAGIGILYFLTLKPKEGKISKELELTFDERSELGIK